MSPFKIKVLVHSNYSKLLTGFGKNAKNILVELDKDENIEVVEAANGLQEGGDTLTPWEGYGTYPTDPHLLKEIKKSPAMQRAATYGFYCIDKIIEEVKPDIYIGIEDVWAFNQFKNKDWWKKTKTIIWTTIDSLPIIDLSKDLYENCDQMFTWATFAERAMKDIGCKTVKTLHGAIDYSNFFPIKEKSKIRSKFDLDEKFVIGFVCKNQLRKSIPNLLEGFKRFKKKNPKSKPKLLLHTDWAEKTKGWDIVKYISEKRIDNEDILATYVCSNCGEYHISSYIGEEISCPYCKCEKGLKTKTSVKGVEESQLNEIYNLMDVYCHPFTSGGQELPIQEAKSSGLIPLVTDYSCGEDSSKPEQGGIPLSWNEYREPATQFIKASTDPDSICKNLEKVLLMSSEEKNEYINRGKKNINENFSSKVIAVKLKKEIIELNNKDKKKIKEEKKKPNANININSFLDDEGQKNRLIIVIPESAGDVLMVNALVKNIKKTYPDKNIYISTKSQFSNLINDNPYVHKIIPYSTSFDNLYFLEGIGQKNGFFEIAFLPFIGSQRLASYTHNGSDKIQFFNK